MEETLRPPDAIAASKPCPSEQAWIDLAAGALNDLESETLMQHAAACRICATALREAVAIFDGVPGMPPLDSSHAHGNAGDAELARKMAGKGWRNWRTLGTFLAIAAGLVIGLWTLLGRERAPMHLLAQAYTSRRNVELRVPGAAYAPLIVERQGAAQSPVELLDAQVIVRRRLDRDPGNTAFLHAQGRAYLLEWRHRDAIVVLQSAASHGLNNPDFWIDFGTAYFERGEADHEPTDYQKAVECLNRALRERPQDAVALFNRGVVQTKLFLRAPAIADFESALGVEKDKAWRKEIESRLESIRKLKPAVIPRLRWTEP